MQTGPSHSEWQWNTTCAILYAIFFGTVMIVLGLWCEKSTDIPTPPLALPLPGRFLSGLAFMLLNPVTLVPMALIFTKSRFLVAKLPRGLSVMGILVGLAFVLAGACWVPNPIILWPMEILGDHPLAELIGQVCPFHIVPSPGGDLMTSDSFDSLFRWQIEECAARFGILITTWVACLAPIGMINQRQNKIDVTSRDEFRPV